ncbi:MAG: hypothetical protein QGD96_09785 [Anaerolineae bacterium]|nr:hypothetical protein [Anaerolineae bacterium]
MASDDKLVLEPGNQFPEKAVKKSVQKFSKAEEAIGGANSVFTWNIATSADSIVPWGKNVAKRDKELRDFWPTETYIAGALAAVCLNRASLDWEIQGPNEKAVNSITDMLNSAIGAAAQEIGWIPYELAGVQDLYSQDNGRFEEIIRDPGEDANSKFKDERAPVIGLAHLDAAACIRTGDPEFPVIYTDQEGKIHKMPWYSVMPSSDFPSPIQSMNGVGHCCVTRALRIAQIMRSIEIFKDEKIGGRQHKQIHFVSGVSRTEIKDEILRGQEEANNMGNIRFILPSILASLDPEKPVTVATIDLANLPDGFDFDQEMQWYISGLALAFGVDYQEFAPLPGGNIGSASQSMILHRKTSGKSPATYMRRKVEAYRNYGVLPRGYTMIYNDKDEQEEMERQEVRTGAIEEVAIAVNQGILSPEAAAKTLVARGIYEEAEIAGLEPFWALELEERKQTVGNRGGNTLREDSKRQNTGKKDMTVGDRLRKMVRK